MVFGGQRHAPAALPPVKTRYPLYRRLTGPQGRSGRKISPPPGFFPRTVQPVASRTNNNVDQKRTDFSYSILRVLVFTVLSVYLWRTHNGMRREIIYTNEVLIAKHEENEEIWRYNC